MSGHPGAEPWSTGRSDGGGVQVPARYRSVATHKNLPQALPTGTMPEWGVLRAR